MPLQVAQNVWLSVWSQAGPMTSDAPAPALHYLLIYAGLGGVAVILWVSMECLQWKHLLWLEGILITN